MNDSVLREEVSTLNGLLDEIIREVEGNDRLELVTALSALAHRRRSGEVDAERELIRRIEDLGDDDLLTVIEAFSVYFDLANLAEDRHRVRVLAERERSRFPDPRAESVADAIRQLQDDGRTADEVQAILDRLDIELIFTAHPTEAKRKSVREKIRDLRDHLTELDDAALLPRERERIRNLIRGDLFALWQTDLLRQRRPTVSEEVNRALFFATTLWDVVPKLDEDLRDALAKWYPDHTFRVPRFLRFGSWIGGDRDGHPGVTWEVTRSTMRTLRAEAIDLHIEQCRLVRRSLSITDRRVPGSDAVRAAIERAAKRWPDAAAVLEPIASREGCRRWLRLVQWRLERTRNADPLGESPEGAYSGATALQEDLALLAEALAPAAGGALIAMRLRRWMRQVDVFGFHLNRLDVRQESTWYHEVIAEVFAATGLHADYAALDEPGRQQALSEAMSREVTVDLDALSDKAQETLRLFRLLAEMVRMDGPDSLGGQVISMTHQPSDVLAVLWLGSHAAQEAGLADARLPMPIIPLFETIDDLRNAPETLEALLNHPLYRAHVDATGKRQIVMVGYSDSTKDGGYLSACWNLYRAQMAIHQATEKHGVKLTIFHGRGGSLGRGGGPAARSIRSLPPETLDGSIRITEQGEVLAERYDDPRIAYRHLEQMTWATLLVTATKTNAPSDRWQEIMESFAQHALDAYRALVDRDGFIQYFDQATPISEVEGLPIGSRPARRKGERALSNLRAIPWVFSWTQSRHMLPAWFGLGSGFVRLCEESDAAIGELRSMYQSWPFFEATIANAEIALAKADLGIAQQYARLVDDETVRERIYGEIAREFDASRRAVLAITGRTHLLESVPWLERSIAVRNPYVDPLNFVQTSLLTRLRELDGDEADPTVARAKQLARLSVQAIAGGLRTTG